MNRVLFECFQGGGEYSQAELGNDILNPITHHLGPKKKIRNFGHMSKIGLPYLPSTLVWTKKKFGQVSPCLPYLPFQKVWTFWNKKLLVIFTLFS